MKPIRVSTSIPRSIGEVFEWLDFAPNHALLLDHMWTDFEFAGPVRGVGARTKARARRRGPEDWTETKVVVAERPRLLLERGVAAHGRRLSEGTYTLAPVADDVTEVTFELRFLQLPGLEKVIVPLLRRPLHRALEQAMQRLRAELVIAPAGKLAQSPQTGRP